MFFAHPLALEAFVRSFFVCLCASVSACAIRSSTWSPLVCALGRVCQRAAAQSENHKNWASAASSSSCWLPWRKLQFQQVHRISSRMCMSETRLRKVQTDGFWSYTCRRVCLTKAGEHSWWRGRVRRVTEHRRSQKWRAAFWWIWLFLTVSCDGRGLDFMSFPLGHVCEHHLTLIAGDIMEVLWR